MLALLRTGVLRLRGLGMLHDAGLSAGDVQTIVPRHLHSVPPSKVIARHDWTDTYAHGHFGKHVATPLAVPLWTTSSLLGRSNQCHKPSTSGRVMNPCGPVHEQAGPVPSTQ